MFGFGSKKSINYDLLSEKLADVVFNQWLDEPLLEQDYVVKVEFFHQKLVGKLDNNEDILTETLFLTVAFALLATEKITKETFDPKQFFKNLWSKLVEIDIQEKIEDLDVAKIEKHANIYVDYFRNLSPKEAGNKTEIRFSEKALGEAPLEKDVDANHALYKALTRYQRSEIFSVQQAIRQSRA